MKEPSSVPRERKPPEATGRTNPAKAGKEAAKKKADREKEAAKKKADREKEAAKKKADREKEAAKKKADREKEAAKKKADRDSARASQASGLPQPQSDADRARAERAQLALRAKEERQRSAQARQAEAARLRAEKAAAAAQVKVQRQAEKERLQQEKQARQAQQVETRKREEQERAAAREKAKQEQRLERERLSAAAREQRELDKQRLKDQREAERERLRQEARQQRELDKQRLKDERQAERDRLKQERQAERDRAKEEARVRREQERAAKEAERAAYRKAKEAEQVRLRAEKEATRKAMEGRVAKAGGRAHSGGARPSTSTRVYSPGSIPNQSGTRRPNTPAPGQRSTGSTLPPGSSARWARSPKPPPRPSPVSVEQRYSKLQEKLAAVDGTLRRQYDENFLMSWIHHDSALEGVVYTYEELRTAVGSRVTVVPDSSLQSVCDEIRRHKTAIELVRELGKRKGAPCTLEQLKRIYLTLHPEDGGVETVCYRKEVPQHRLYFHEYTAPDKIQHKVRQVFDWLSSSEPRKLKGPVHVAARVHFDLLRIFPFTVDSGKAIRLFVNLYLLRADFPPILLHATERQRYYDALKNSTDSIVTMMDAALINGLLSMEKQVLAMLGRNG